MKDIPILFSAPMVRALLAGTKTQTRRVCKPAATLSAVVEVPDPMERGQVYNGSHFGDEDGAVQFACPYGGRGDRLWVREAWAPRTLGAWSILDKHLKPIYKASEDRPEWKGIWKPSIHMPRWASRITLEVTEVRVERLQDISEADARAEGVAWEQGQTAANVFESLWESINGPGSWEANPWVWAVSFKRITP